MKIWKYPINLTDITVLTMPAGAQVLAVQTQRDDPFLWALVEPAATQATRRFRLVGTGHDFDPTGSVYIGTFQLDRGNLVFHLFEDEALSGP